MPDFTPLIRVAYLEILDREPDPSGLAGFDVLMRQGLSEAAVREALLRSPEYAQKNPDPGLPTRIGLNVHLPSDPMIEDITSGLGMRWVRLDFDWFRMEPEQGALRFEETDRVVARFVARGTEMMATIAYTPAWASSNPASPQVSDPPRQTAFWTDFVGRVLRRYRDRVRFWQFWNEPNLRQFWSGSRDQFRTEILEPAATLLRSIAPDLQSVAPGLAHVRDWRDWFREAMIARDVIDVVDHHNYQRSGRDVILLLERDEAAGPSMRRLIDELGVADKPFWITETGINSGDADQRRYYQDVVDVLQERTWVDRLFFFHYWDGPGQGNGGPGIVDEDFSPKPSYLFLRSVLHPAAAAATSVSGRLHA
jgi:Glycosyl hydrolases family 39